MERNYNTISPSAKTLLLMKGATNIPFAREMAEMMMKPETYTPDFSNEDPGYWARIVHFEQRYWSINQLLEGLAVKNVLELSSGYSFRGLDIVKQSDVHYIDTDLPEVVAAKQEFLKELQKEDLLTQGKLEILPLNALDEERFMEVVSRFPEGEIAIVNEGLLMYLDEAEKAKLCRIIHRVLEERGGYWITADIYLRRDLKEALVKMSEKEQAFFAQHLTEEKKFESFSAAEEFFKEQGFLIDKKAEVDTSKLSTLKYLTNNMSASQLQQLQQGGQIQQTWRLKLAEK